MVGANRAIEGTLPLRTPHDAVHVVGFRPILDECGEEFAQVRVIEASLPGGPAININLRNLFKVVQQAGTVNVFEPAVALHFRALCFGHHGREQVEVAEVGRAKILKDRLGVKLGMEGRVIPAMKTVRVVPLRTVVRQGWPGT